MIRKRTTFLAALSLVCFIASTGRSHFLWLVPMDETNSKVSLYFSEGPEPDNPELLKRVSSVQATPYRTPKPGSLTSFTFTEDGTRLVATSPGATAWTLTHTFGTHGKEEKNLIVYTASSVVCKRPGMQDSDWIPLPKTNFTAEPMFDGKELVLSIFVGDEPARNQSFELQSPNDHQTLETNLEGVAKIAGVQPGVYAIRLVRSEEQHGEYEGAPYRSTKHYTTVSFIVPKLDVVSSIPNLTGQAIELPKAITSFGATRMDNSIYVYGGHTGGAHSYSYEEQFNTLAKLDLSQPNPTWERIAEGPRVQGNALVADSQSVLLIGGFSAENKTGEKSRLVSQSLVQAFDLHSKTWSSLPSLPEPRSSMDAICLDGFVYVVGGWHMNGNGPETKWHETAWRLSLEKKDQWQPIATPPFRRRAVALASHAGKVYVVGGMDSSGQPTTAVDCFDPIANSWSECGSISGVPMNGFGAAASEIDGKLIVSTVDGSIQQLNDSTRTWTVIGQIATGRFFHRMVPSGNRELAIIGGANMSVGKFKETEFIRIAR